MESSVFFIVFLNFNFGRCLGRPGLHFGSRVVWSGESGFVFDANKLTLEVRKPRLTKPKALNHTLCILYVLWLETQFSERQTGS